LLFHRVTTFGSPATFVERSVALRTRLTVGLPLSSGASRATPFLNGRVVSTGGVNPAKSALVYTVDHYQRSCQEALRLLVENSLALPRLRGPIRVERSGSAKGFAENGQVTFILQLSTGVTSPRLVSRSPLCRSSHRVLVEQSYALAPVLGSWQPVSKDYASVSPMLTARGPRISSRITCLLHGSVARFRR
jgi:hypothetical protein